MPVAVYWGRAPQKEASWFRLLLVEDWALTSRLRKFLQVLFNGRATLIEIDEPVSLRSLLGKDADVVRCRGGGWRARLRALVPQAARGAHRPRSLASPHDRDARSAYPRGARRRGAGDAREEDPAPQGHAARATQCARRSPPTTRMPSCASWSSC